MSKSLFLSGDARKRLEEQRLRLCGIQNQLTRLEPMVEHPHSSCRVQGSTTTVTRGRERANEQIAQAHQTAYEAISEIDLLSIGHAMGNFERVVRRSNIKSWIHDASFMTLGCATAFGAWVHGERNMILAAAVGAVFGFAGWALLNIREFVKMRNGEKVDFSIPGEVERKDFSFDILRLEETVRYLERQLHRS